LMEIEPLVQLIKTHQPEASEEDKYFLMEMVLWALAENSKLNKERIREGFNFADLFGSYLRSGEL